MDLRTPKPGADRPQVVKIVVVALLGVVAGFGIAMGSDGGEVAARDVAEGADPALAPVSVPVSTPAAVSVAAAVAAPAPAPVSAPVAGPVSVPAPVSASASARTPSSSITFGRLAYLRCDPSEPGPLPSPSPTCPRDRALEAALRVALEGISGCGVSGEGDVILEWRGELPASVRVRTRPGAPPASPDTQAWKRCVEARVEGVMPAQTPGTLVIAQRLSLP